MSDVEQEQVPDTAPEVAPDETPDEQPQPGEAPDEEEEAHEAEQQESEQVEGGSEQPQGLSEKQLNAMFGKLERATVRHTKRIQEITGDDFEGLLVCPLCDTLTPGYVMPMPNTPERFPAVREFMGDAVPQEWQQDPNTRTCQTCDGLGMVATGSKVEGQAQLVCTDCGGKGWQGVRPAVAASGPMAPQPVPEDNGQATPTPQGPEPPEAAKLRAMGYTLIQPVGT